MPVPKTVAIYLALLTIAFGNMVSAEGTVGFSFDQAMLESSLEAAAAEGVAPVAYLQDSPVVLEGPTNEAPASVFQIESVDGGNLSWRRLDRWRFGVEFVSLSRSDKITFSPGGVVAESGVNSGLRFAATIFDRAGDPNSDAWEAIFCYAAGSEENVSASGREIATGEASMLDVQLNRRLAVHSGTRSAALRGGLRVFSLDDAIDLPTYSRFRAESQNLLVGGQVGIDSHWQPSRLGFGGGVSAGAYFNGGEAVTTYRPPYSSSDLATSIELDVNATYEVSETTHLMVGLYVLALGGIQSARDVASFQPDYSDAISYGGVRLALVRSIW